MHKNWKFHHIGMVVNDMEKAISQLSALEVGPFPPFIGGAKGMQVENRTVGGYHSDYDMDLRYAESSMDGIAYELIQPLKGRSIYDDFLEKKGEGFHHLGFLVEDLDKEIAEMEARGFKVTQTGGRSKSRWAYFNTDEISGGFIIELIQRG